MFVARYVSEADKTYWLRLGYIDRGGLFLDNTPIEQPQELFMLKVLYDTQKEVKNG